MLRLQKYRSIVSTRRGKLSKSQVHNGIRHYRVQIKEPLPSYLRFGKFLVRLSHDGQQHTCRRCNRAGHFANECQNTVCFNCDELGHQSRECKEPVRCCICKSVEHRACRCPFSWYRPSTAATPSLDVSDPSSGGNVAAPASDPPSSLHDPSPDGDVAASAGDLSHSSSRCVRASRLGIPRLFDFLATPALSPDVSSARVLDSQGLISVQPVSRGVVPNPPGPPSSLSQSSVDTDGPSADPPADQPAVPSVDTGDQSPDPPMDSSADPPVDQPVDPSVDTDDQPSDPPMEPSADLPSDQPVDPPVDSPALYSDDQPVPPKPARLRSGISSRRKPAPLPPALEALGRRPTRPTLAVSGKSTPADSPPPPPGVDDASEDEMETNFSKT